MGKIFIYSGFFLAFILSAFYASDIHLMKSISTHLLYKCGMKREREREKRSVDKEFELLKRNKTKKREKDMESRTVWRGKFQHKFKLNDCAHLSISIPTRFRKFILCVVCLP